MVEAQVSRRKVLEAVLALVAVSKEKVSTCERRSRPVMIHELLDN